MMFQWFLAIPLLVGVVSEREQPVDILMVVANALQRGDVATLDDMRFQAYGLDNRPMATADLTALLSNCDALERDMWRYRPIRLRYRCAALNVAKAKCDSDILIVDVDRATSPDVFATLYLERSSAPECILPIAPSPQ